MTTLLNALPLNTMSSMMDVTSAVAGCPHAAFATLVLYVAAVGVYLWRHGPPFQQQGAMRRGAIPPLPAFPESAYGHAKKPTPLGAIHNTGSPTYMPRGDICICNWEESRVDMFVTMDNGNLWHTWLTIDMVNNTSGWSGWYNLGGINSEEVYAMCYEPWRIDIFGRNGPNIYHKSFSNTTGWSAWIIEYPGTHVQGPVTACTWMPGLIYWFAEELAANITTVNTTLIYGHWDSVNGWRGPYPFPVKDLSRPVWTVACCSFGQGRLDMFARDFLSNSCKHMAYDYYNIQGGWMKEWVDMGGGLTSAPTCASLYWGRTDVLCRGTDYAGWYTYQDATPQNPQFWWAPWSTLGMYYKLDSRIVVLKVASTVDIALLAMALNSWDGFVYSNEYWAWSSGGYQWLTVWFVEFLYPANLW